MSNRTWSLILCGTYIFGGIVILLSPNPKMGRYSLLHSDYDIDLTSVKNIIGPFLIIFGLYFFYRIYKTPPLEKKFYKCTKCGEVLKVEGGLQNIVCKKCSHPLEKLEGFFERHPEFGREKVDKGNDLK